MMKTLSFALLGTLALSVAHAGKAGWSVPTHVPPVETAHREDGRPGQGGTVFRRSGFETYGLASRITTMAFGRSVPQLFGRYRSHAVILGKDIRRPPHFFDRAHGRAFELVIDKITSVSGARSLDLAALQAPGVDRQATVDVLEWLVGQGVVDKRYALRLPVDPAQDTSQAAGIEVVAHSPQWGPDGRYLSDGYKSALSSLSMEQRDSLVGKPWRRTPSASPLRASPERGGPVILNAGHFVPFYTVYSEDPHARTVPALPDFSSPDIYAKE